MLDVTIDVGVLAVPRDVRSAEDVHRYVDTLLDWKMLLNEPWVAIRMSERASEALVEGELYPLRDELRKLFNEHGITEYTVNDVARVAEHLLTITPHFETYYNLQDVLADPLETDPDIVRLSTHQRMQTDLARCVVLMAILRKHCRQPLGGHSLILRSAPNPIVRVRAQIHLIEHERDDITNLPLSPEFFEGEILVCDNFKGLVGCLDESVILAGASDNLGAELAIKVALFKDDLKKGKEPDWAGAAVPKIGHGFLETCQRCCHDQGQALSPKILRAVVETMLNQNMAAVHPLRVGRGGDDPQRMRGTDKAQRRDIDYEFHLHYWECAVGAIELGSVVHHNDFSIPE